MLPGAGEGDRVLPAGGVPDRERGDKGAGGSVLGIRRGRPLPLRCAVGLRCVKILKMYTVMISSNAGGAARGAL